MTIGDALFSEPERCNNPECGRPATKFIIATLQGPVTFQVCSNCDHRLCPNHVCAQPITDPFATTCTHCQADVRLTAPQTND